MPDYGNADLHHGRSFRAAGFIDPVMRNRLAASRSQAGRSQPASIDPVRQALLRSGMPQRVVMHALPGMHAVVAPLSVEIRGLTLRQPQIDLGRIDFNV